MSDKTKAELKEQIRIMNHNYHVIKEMQENGYQYSVKEINRLQQELIKTKQALDVAIDTLKYENKCIKGNGVDWRTEIDKTLDQIKQITETKDE